MKVDGSGRLHHGQICPRQLIERVIKEQRAVRTQQTDNRGGRKCDCVICINNIIIVETFEMDSAIISEP